jgi:hypothetical protein
MSWWKCAKPGDKVVCVNDTPGKFTYPNPRIEWIADLDGLTKGRIYTIRKIGQGADPADFDIFVWLQEIYRPSDDFGEPGYHPERFRPVQTKSTETGIAILREILNGARVPEVA